MTSNQTTQAKELIDAMVKFAESMQCDNESTKKEKIARVDRYIDAVNDMQEEDMKYLSKTPEKLMFDLEAYSRHNGTWEKIKLFRSFQL